jgi:cell division transport system permease protein
MNTEALVRWSRIALGVLGDGLKGIFIAKGEALACILSLVVASCLVTAFSIVGFYAGRVIDSAAKRAFVIVYLKEATPHDTLESFIEKIKKRPEVMSVRYLSAEEDRARNKDLLPKEIASLLADDAIPGQHCLEVYLSGKGDAEELVSFLREFEWSDVVAEPPAGAGKVMAIAGLLGVIRLFILVIAGILLLTTLFFVVGTITRTMERRKEQMEILAIVGATPLYLKSPLFVQGVAEGVVGVTLGAWLGVFVVDATKQFAVRELGVLVDPGTPYALATLTGALVGVVIGVVAGAIASRQRTV